MFGRAPIVRLSGDGVHEEVLCGNHVRADLLRVCGEAPLE